MRKDASLQAEGAERPKASEASGAGAAVVIRSAYDRSRVRVGVVCLASEDRTQQSFRDECDINFLMKRYEKTGILPTGRESVPQFGDVTGMDFMASMQQVAEVSGAFSMLDARTRARFENDPSRMLDFLADPANMDEAVKLGLVAKPKGESDGSRKAVAGAGSAGQAGEAREGDSAAGREAAVADRGTSAGAVVDKAGAPS